VNQHQCGTLLHLTWYLGREMDYNGTVVPDADESYSVNSPCRPSVVNSARTVAERGIAPIALILILIRFPAKNRMISSLLLTTGEHHLPRKGNRSDHDTVTHCCIIKSCLAANKAGC